MSKSLILDWKDVAQGFYGKALSLAVLTCLFSFLVSPKIEVQPYQMEVTITVMEDIPPEIRERIQPPEDIIRPQIDLIIDDDLDGADDDIEIVSTIERTTLRQEDVLRPPAGFGETPRFVAYDEAPVAVRRIQPAYPESARRLGIEGQVMLDVEVLRDGSVGKIEVVRSLQPGRGGLDEAAIEAVRRWEFQPAKSSGQPVAVWVRFPVEFRLN